MAYVNPFSRVQGLTPERIDQGVDFSGNGPVLAIGNAQITDAQSSGSGWPGLGGWVSYQLLDGPAAGRQVFVAEDFRPSVSAGQTVAAGQQIGTMSSGSAGIETGWYSGHGHSSLAQDYGGYSEGDHTALGDNFDALLVSLGVPASPNLGHPNRGSVPSGFPGWSGNVPGSSASQTGFTNAGVTSSILDSLLGLFGVPDIKDLAERAGLILFGAAFIVAGILIATKQTGKASEKIKETVNNGTERSQSATSDSTGDTGSPDTSGNDGGLISRNIMES